jgi:hypothetical protein
VETPSRPSNAGRAEFGITDIGTEPIKDAPKLGRRPGGGAYLSATREWWETWQRSPQASQFVETDWLTLRMLAPLVDSYYRDPVSSKLAEIRQAHAKLGATVADRMQLRLRIGTKAPAEPDPEAEDGRRKARPRRGDPRRLHVVDEKSASA